jgi:beta-galactosidase/beta-glucuronidase
VDYVCAVRINGVLANSHVGGYTPFAIDITELLVEGENVLEVCVADPSEFGGKLRGKQRFDRGDIWYTAQSGIWQAVWLESVPALHLVEARIEADLDTGIVAIGARIAGFETNCPANNTPVFSVEILSASGEPIAQSETLVDGATCALAVHVPNVHPWSPDDPYLYQVNLRLNDDFVHSYCGFRSVEIGHDASGAPCISLNHQPLFVKGVLDQAYWSDGLMTAPSDDALIFDIQAMHDAGFNLMRKHIKVECARWYYHCDRLGMLVLQDMVSGGDQDIHTWHWSYKPTLFKPSWNHYRDTLPSHQANLGAGNVAYRKEWIDTSRQVVNTLFNHPCIIGWSLFNEGWGQFDACKATDMVRNLDSTRVIDAVSGWYDQRCGDFKSVHNYFRELEVWPDRKDKRAFFISEFGGFSHRVDGHSALDESYGYEVYDDIAEWRRNVQELLKHMDTMEGKGLAGYIYTQVSDIEEETNGLLTYDRRVNKLQE